MTADVLILIRAYRLLTHNGITTSGKMRDTRSPSLKVRNVMICWCVMLCWLLSRLGRLITEENVTFFAFDTLVCNALLRDIALFSILSGDQSISSALRIFNRIPLGITLMNTRLSNRIASMRVSVARIDYTKQQPRAHWEICSVEWQWQTDFRLI